MLTTPPQNREMEEGLYECMSMACGGWGYQWSQWNEKGGQKGAVIQATPINESERASLRDEPNPDKVMEIKSLNKLFSFLLPPVQFDSWRLYLSTCEKTLALQSKETGEDFSDELPDGKTVSIRINAHHQESEEFQIQLTIHFHFSLSISPVSSSL